MTSPATNQARRKSNKVGAMGLIIEKNGILKVGLIDSAHLKHIVLDEGRLKKNDHDLSFRFWTREENNDDNVQEEEEPEEEY